MFKQQVNEIPLGNGEFMKEFFLESGQSAPVPPERDIPTTKDKEIERLVMIYAHEDFLTVAGRTIPVVHAGSYPLSDIKMTTLEDSFEPATRFWKVVAKRRQRVLDSLLRRGGHDGKNVSVRDWHFVEQEVRLIGQAMRYTQFLSTDNAQDKPLRLDDSTFPAGATLRDYVVVNGKESRKGTDVLSNLLGAAFVVRAKGQDGRDYFVLGRRQRHMASEGGELGVIGGTPMWEEAYFGREEADFEADFAGYMRHLGTDEMGEELVLHAGEISIGSKVHFLRTLVRVFDPFYTVDVDPVITVEDIAARCFGNPSALKEHDRLYAVPRTEAALNGLINSSRGYHINHGSMAGLHMDLHN